MKSVMVVLRSRDVERLVEALRLCTGLSVGGLQLAILAEPEVCRILESANRFAGDPIADQLNLFRELGLKIAMEARDLPGSLPQDLDIFLSITPADISLMKARAEGTIVYR